MNDIKQLHKIVACLSNLVAVGFDYLYTESVNFLGSEVDCAQPMP